MAKSWKDISRVDWQTTMEEDSDGASEKSKIGSLQRIADATEKMAASYDNLRADRDFYKRRFEYERDENKLLRHRLAATQGVVTKLRKTKAEETAK